jgi:tetratricopeptide (TPR) repeat protein
MEARGQARVERRLAAILTADVAGYSRLTEADEEGTLAALRAIRRELGDPKIAEHRGRIVKTTGDGLLVEFASVVDAVRCAVELQREMIAQRRGTGRAPHRISHRHQCRRHHHRGWRHLRRRLLRHRPQLRLHLQGQAGRREASSAGTGRALRARRQRAQSRQPGAHRRAIDRHNNWRSHLGRPLRRRARRHFRVARSGRASVAGAIEPKLRQSEIERASRKPTANLTAYDLYLRALAQSYRFTEESFAEAVVLARRALAIDPSYAPAAALVGLCRGQQRLQAWGALSDEDIGEACRLARQALEAERDDAETICRAAWTLLSLAGESALAAAAVDRALVLNPNAARAWVARGLIHAVRNQPEAAIEAIERARRLSPFDPYTFLYALNIAGAHLFARRFGQAIEWADRALHDQPRLVTAMRIKVAASAHLGHLDEARAELRRVLAIDPKLTTARFHKYVQYMAPEVRELYVTGLRLAGLPEGDGA